MSISLVNAITRHDFLIQQAKRIPHPPTSSPKKRNPISSNDDFVVPEGKYKKPTPKAQPTHPSPTEPPKKQPVQLGGGVNTGDDPLTGVSEKHKKRGHK